MARTTAAHGRAAGADRCVECNAKAEATVTGTDVRNDETVAFRVCLSHTLRYVLTDGVDVTPDPEANVALCACNRFVGHNGRAAHRCSAATARERTTC